MAVTYLMQLLDENSGRLDRIGGLPTHLPDQFPAGADGQALAFVAQFEVVEPRLQIEGVDLIQVYQDPEFDPWPVAVPLGGAAPRNLQHEGREHPLLPKREIVWHKREEPVEPGDWESAESLPTAEEGKLQSSKASGFCYYDNAIETGERFLLQLTEEGLAGRVFGGWSLILLLNARNELEARLS